MGPVPATVATPPRTGPKRAPATAAANARPISRPFTPAGALATSQASDPVHENELDSPCRNRALSSCHSWSTTPKSAVVIATPTSPTSTVGLTPNRAETMPLGIAPTSVPSG